MRAANGVRSLAGLVTLGTPFVHVSIPSKRRALGQVVTRLLIFLGTPYLVVGLAVAVIGLVVTLNRTSDDASIAVMRLWLYGLGVPFAIVTWRLKKILRYFSAINGLFAESPSDQKVRGIHDLGY